MEITFTIDETKLRGLVDDEIRYFIKRKIEEDFIGDAMSKHWEIIDREIDDYIKSEEFVEKVREAIRDSEEALIGSIKNRITGNF